VDSQQRCGLAAELRRYPVAARTVRRLGTRCSPLVYSKSDVKRFALATPRGSLVRFRSVGHQGSHNMMLGAGGELVGRRRTATSSCGPLARAVRAARRRREGQTSGRFYRWGARKVRSGEPHSHCRERRAQHRRGITNAEAVADLRRAPTRCARWRIVVARRSLAIGVMPHVRLRCLA
jgi:hypothetical protein